MSGVYLEITRDTASPRLDNAIAALDGDGLQLMFDHIGEYLVRTTRERGEAQVSPDGTPFAPLSERYRRYKEKKRPGVPILRFDFHMQGDQLSHQVAGDTLYVGTNAIYGATHQFGRTIELPDGRTAEIPARPWLGLSADDEKEVLAIAHDHLSGMFAD